MYVCIPALWLDVSGPRSMLWGRDLSRGRREYLGHLREWLLHNRLTPVAPESPTVHTVISQSIQTSIKQLISQSINYKNQS